MRIPVDARIKFYVQRTFMLLLRIHVNALYASSLDMMIYVVPAVIYLFQVNNGNPRTMCEICSKLTMKRLE